MPEESEQGALTEAQWRRLKKYNPFLVSLNDRHGARRDNLKLFDGESKLVKVPILEFDGYPAESDYPYFAPALILVGATALLPLAPFVWPDNNVLIGGIFLAYVCACIVLGVAAAFHLVYMRTLYKTASSDILAANFVTRARGIRELIHTFKRILRWRRFMRYAMNFGFLLLVGAGAGYGFLAGRTLLAAQPDTMLISGALFATGVVWLILFEAGRRKFTRGVDPSLALAIMVEEIGGQLLAGRQARLVGGGSG